MVKNFSEAIRKYIKHNRLLESDGKYLVALSGGADSVALLLILKKMNYQVEACHCNFHLRGEESNRDEQFCINLCKHLGIELHRTHFDTKSYAEVHKVSIEMAARNLRYHYFEQLRKDISAKGICVAHHQDDSVETVLINMLRGTGIEGMIGIAPKNGYILRPLLGVSKVDILTFLKKEKQNYVTDSSNLVADVVRNKIRLQVIPLLKEITPTAVNNIAKTIYYLKEANKQLDEVRKNMAKAANIDMRYGISSISKSWIEKSMSPEFSLYTALANFKMFRPVISEILDSLNVVGKMWETDTHQLVIDRENLYIKKKTKELFHSLTIPETGTYILPANTVYLDRDESQFPKLIDYQNATIQDQRFQVKSYDGSVDISIFKYSKAARSNTCILDADTVTFPLTLRRVQTGDRFRPFGMTKGTKLVSDYLTNKRVNLFYKKNQWVLIDATDKIIWLVDRTICEDCKVTTDTKHFLEIKLSLQSGLIKENKKS